MTQPIATADTRALALEMFKDNVPCFFALEDPPCPNAAAWVVYFRHLADVDCNAQPPFPVCPEHRRLIERTTHPFWRAWLNTQPVPCEGCGEELAIDRFEAIT
ncbi:hypothetical protein [Streptomyces sp. OK228]|uniref:hypothetical protein n=1 Tax=Streptomyces sp. OK228 TaxID=1882786 RepID=UPI000BDCB46C|nr:hypothetical protein [Streptomyces sp. OK228]SOE25657.1 hypothetical protein SAMN05442782_2400 [Streptomyces sp. OK228]